MATPPRGDPRRPLSLAVSSCRVLGVLGLLLGTCVGVTVGRLRAGAGLPGLIAVVSALALYGGSGAAYLVFAHYIKRRRFWAVVAALCLTSFIALGLLFGVVAQVLVLAHAGVGRAGVFPAIAGVELLILVAVAQLIYHLARSFEAIRLAPPDEARGFDVLPVAVVPTEPLHELDPEP